MDNLFLVPVRAGVTTKSFAIANGTTSQLFPLFSEEDLKYQQLNHQMPFRVINHSLNKQILPYVPLSQDDESFKGELIKDYQITPYAIVESQDTTAEVENLSTILSAYEQDNLKTVRALLFLCMSAKCGEYMWYQQHIDGVQDLKTQGQFMIDTFEELREAYKLVGITEQMMELIGEKPVKDLQRFFARRGKRITQKLYEGMDQDERGFAYRNLN